MIFLPSEAPGDDLQDIAVIWRINLELRVPEEGIFIYRGISPLAASLALSGNIMLVIKNQLSGIDF